MSANYKLENMPDMLPYLVVQDAVRSISFYEKAFGFEVINMFCPENAMDIPTKSPATLGIEETISLYCYVKDVDSFHQNAVENGANSYKEPEDSFWGDRMCALTDPDGYKWSFATYLGVQK